MIHKRTKHQVQGQLVQDIVDKTIKRTDRITFAAKWSVEIYLSRCNSGLLGQKPEVEIFWREIQKLVMGLFEFYFP